MRLEYLLYRSGDFDIRAFNAVYIYRMYSQFIKFRVESIPTRTGREIYIYLYICIYYWSEGVRVTKSPNGTIRMREEPPKSERFWNFQIPHRAVKCSNFPGFPNLFEISRFSALSH